MDVATIGVFGNLLCDVIIDWVTYSGYKFMKMTSANGLRTDKKVGITVLIRNRKINSYKVYL